MASKSASGASFGPLFLRLCLGVVFIWAGLGKVLSTSVVSGDDVALLAEMGVAPKAATPTPTSPTTPTSAPTPAAKSGTAGAKPSGGAAAVRPVGLAAGTGQLEVSRAYVLALSIKKNTMPGAVDGKPTARLWPEFLGQGRYPVYAAFACVLTELIGGALVLVGALTRVSAAGLACVMATAMWLTQIGPAVRSGATTLGFLPAHPAFDTAAWQPLMLQFALFCSAVALLMLGCGRLGLDTSLFPRGGGPTRPKAEPAA